MAAVLRYLGSRSRLLWSSSGKLGAVRRPLSSVAYPLQLASVSEQHSSWYKESIQNPERFWGDVARERLRWTKDFHTTLDCSMANARFNWFLGGQLNVSDNCLDRHVEQNPDRVALIWEKDEPNKHEKVTYKQLLEMTCQVANVLKRQGVQKGDRVAIYMPVSPIAAATMLACTRIGAVHSVVFAGFSAEALRSRINDAQAETVVTADEGVRGGKTIPLKATVDEAVTGCECVKKVLVATRTGANIPMTDKDLRLEEEMSKEAKQCPAEPLDSEDPLYMLYTSGSTGKPKGILHTQAGYLLMAGLTTQLVFDYHPGDIFACVADIGWITGHSHAVYGPLSNGGTSILFESIPTYPDPGRYWEMVERLKVTQLYLAPTSLRLLLKCGDEYVHKYDRSTLRVLGCVGEPLNDEAWLWYHSVVGEGRCTVVDTWWQTETGGIMITPRPSTNNLKPKPGFPMNPFFGIEPVLMSDDGKEIEGNNVTGNLCIRKPWPSMARTIYGDHQKYKDTYFKRYAGLYFTGDGAYRDGDGHYQITGRVDDVINVKGHRIGTAELESAMDHDNRVAETAVVGFPHEVFGEGVYAYVVLKDGVTDTSEEVEAALRKLIKTQIGSFAVPNTILVTPGLPKTRSGKIMRRILRKISSNQFQDLGDITTLADSSVVEQIVNSHKQKTSDKV